LPAFGWQGTALDRPLFLSITGRWTPAREEG
jgi:hypothetical protein